MMNKPNNKKEFVTPKEITNIKKHLGKLIKISPKAFKNKYKDNIMKNALTFCCLTLITRWINKSQYVIKDMSYVIMKGPGKLSS